MTLARRAEDAGFDSLFVDGDVSQIASRGEGDVLDGWTLTCALLARTSRLRIGSIRLVHHWHAAKLAQAVATQQRITPGRLRFLVSIGGQPADARFGLPLPPAADRVVWLDETLDAVVRLWRGETLSAQGRFVQLDAARVRPAPGAGAIRVEVAGRGARLLDVVARHADVWDVNLPAWPERAQRASDALATACRRHGRDPASIARSMWIFTRPDVAADDPRLLADVRRWCPWFRDVPDDALLRATACGRGANAADRLRALAIGCAIDLPLADLSGLDFNAARRAIDALAPGARSETTPDVPRTSP